MYVEGAQQTYVRNKKLLRHGNSPVSECSRWLEIEDSQRFDIAGANLAFESANKTFLATDCAAYYKEGLPILIFHLKNSLCGEISDISTIYYIFQNIKDSM